ncbi:NmrA family transcriptional regulator [Nonomuraea antimicrobica]
MANGDLGDVMNVVRAVGVRRVVLLSSHGVGTRRHSSHLEDAVEQSGLEWTMLRPGNFNSNTFQWADSVRAQRMVVAPFGDVAVPGIDPADIAEVAAVALREPGHEGAIYTLTGPVPISPRQQAAAIGDVVGEPVQFVEQSRAEARNQMLRYMPEPVVEATLGALGAPSAAEQRVSPDVERLLGRPPRTFAEWAERNVAAFE